MKKGMNIKAGLIRYIWISFMILISSAAYSQGAARIDPYIQLSFFNRNGNHILETALTYSRNRMEMPLPGFNVIFYSGTGSKEVIGDVATNEKGVASLLLNQDQVKKFFSKGSVAFSARFGGNDTINPGLSEINVREISLEVNLTEADSIRTMTFKASAPEGNKLVPVQGEVVKTYITRMFSLLPVGESTLDENGTAALEFPKDLPGDKDGNLTIISRIEDSPSYGTVENRTIKSWGVPTSYSPPVVHRALWTKTPPMWMIITLSILLTGVWGHYLFAIISLILIRRDASKRKNKKETKIAR